jgi:hypothetical protein
MRALRSMHIFAIAAIGCFVAGDGRETQPVAIVSR